MPSDDGTEAEFSARISTHILDTTTGEPARGVDLRLEVRDNDGWRTVAEGRTDDDGRFRFRLHECHPGGYRLFFDTGPYLGGDAFFPEVTVTFYVPDPERHYHVPLLLSPYGYTTYRGS